MKYCIYKKLFDLQLFCNALTLYLYFILYIYIFYLYLLFEKIFQVTKQIKILKFGKTWDEL